MARYIALQLQNNTPWGMNAWVLADSEMVEMDGTPLIHASYPSRELLKQPPTQKTQQ